jgi:hypothetical protein
MSLGIVIMSNGNADPSLVLADRVEVLERMGETTYYSVFYPEDISNGDMNWSGNTLIDPGTVLTIIAGADTTKECLVMGPVFSHQIHLQQGGEGSAIEVKGADSSITLDREFQSAIWNNASDSDAVSTILGNYGYSTDVYDTSTVHSEDKHTLVQRETDLRFIRRLARMNGCYFWITCDTSANETAHFQRPALGGDPVVQLTINIDNPTCQTVDISWNAENPTSVTGEQLDLDTKNTIDGSLAQSPLAAMGAKGLMDITGDTRSIHVAAPADDAGDMQAKSEGALIEADWFVRARCTTSLHLLGKLVHANTVVSLGGAGSRHSGNYFVYSVRHMIDASDHLMEIELIRNAWNTSSGSSGLSIPSL